MHQHDRGGNRELFAKVRRAIEPDGVIVVRDVVMRPDRTEPVMGALFAINMLVNTDSGATFTYQELADDMMTAGFIDPKLVVEAVDMNSIVTARAG